MNITEAQTLARSLMDSHGLTDWRLVISQAKRQFGSCEYGTKIIRLSQPLTELNDLVHVNNTILHEIAHALTPRDAGHGKEWKRVAISIGCTGNRHYSDEVVRPHIQRSTYQGTCPNCQRRIYRHARRHISCGQCSKVYNPAYRITWKKIEGKKV